MFQEHARRWSLVVGLLLTTLCTGCAAFRPVYGVPARFMPDEFRGASRSGKRTIDLSLLRQSPPPRHLVDTDDLLSIYVEGVLGRRDEQPPVHFPQNADTPPTVGYPIPVRDDGTISMPLIGALSVRGMSIREVEDALRRAYTVDQQLLQPGRDRIFVALQQPRTFRVLVIRQEASSDVSIGAQGQLNIGALKRGTGQVVNLPVYKNDVLNALAETGGLPGLDAENAIYVIRRREHRAAGVPSLPYTTPAPTPLPPPPASALHPSEKVIRGQSPAEGSARYGDYRSRGHAIGQFTKPAAAGGRYASAPHADAATDMPSLPTPAAMEAPPAQPQRPHAPVSYRQPGFSAPAMSPGYAADPYAQPVLQPQPQAPLQSPYPQGQYYQEVQPGFGAPNWTTAPTDVGPALDGWQGSTMEAPYAPGTVGNWPVDIGHDLNNRHIVRIPVRLGPGEQANICEQDILLYDGDIIFIESRDTEVFYTGGLLGGGQYTLPRDYDLDVLGAIAVAQGQQGGGSGSSRATQSQGGQSALNNDVSISASQLIILRPLPDGTQLTIQVDLYEAVRNPNERIIVQPGDYLLLQYTRCEAVMAFFERHLLEGALFGLAAAQFNQGR